MSPFRAHAQDSPAVSVGLGRPLADSKPENNDSKPKRRRPMLASVGQCPFWPASGRPRVAAVGQWPTQGMANRRRGWAGAASPPCGRCQVPPQWQQMCPITRATTTGSARRGTRAAGPCRSLWQQRPPSSASGGAAWGSLLLSTMWHYVAISAASGHSRHGAMPPQPLVARCHT